jgi:imidazolonepropionase-like amidohydrolase
MITMKRITLLLGIFLLYPTLVIGQESQQDSEEEVLPVVIRNVTLIDGNGGKPRSNVSILIAEDSIIGIVDDERDIPIESKIFDFTGHYVIPGLIDSHAHVAFDSRSQSNREYTNARLRHALYGGITTVRDMVGDGRVLTSLARDAVLDEIESPDIYYSTYIAAPEFLYSDPRLIPSSRGAALGKTSYMMALDEDDDLKEAITLARGSGATGIKVYAEYDREMFRKLTEEAHRQGMKVWAHAALVPAKPSDVVAAGPDVISHVEMFFFELYEFYEAREKQTNKSFDFPNMKVDEPVIVKVFEEMERKNVILDATLISEKRLEYGKGWFKYCADLVALAHKMGVLIAAGTDNMGEPNDHYLPNLFEEMESYVDYSGLTPLEAITTATLNGAKSIGIEETHGTLEVGKKANMVILKADPSRNIRNAREIKLTIKNGKFYDRSFYNPVRFNSIVEEGPEISTDWDKKEKNNNH